MNVVITIKLNGIIASVIQAGHKHLIPTRSVRMTTIVVDMRRFYLRRKPITLGAKPLAGDAASQASEVRETVPQLVARRTSNTHNTKWAAVSAVSRISLDSGISR